MLRWFKLSPVPESLWLEVEKIRPRHIPISNPRVDIFLFGSFRESQEIVEVKVRVGVDTDNECYQVKFSSGHTIEVDDTYELITLLKNPYLKGMPFRTEDGHLLFWDNKTDIEYSDVSTRQNEEFHVIHLSFLKPLVHRAIFFSINDLLPKTCRELLKTTDGGTVTLVVEVDELRRNQGKFDFIKIKFKGLPEKSQLKNIEGEWMNPYDLELLLESVELVDTSVGKNFTIDADVSQLRGIRLPSGIKEDSQLISSLYTEDEEYEETAPSLPEGEWMLTSDIKGNMIQWTLNSPLTKRSWMDTTFDLNLNGSLSLEEMIEKFVGELRMMGVSRKNIFNYDEEIDGIREGLRNCGWGDEKPPCRAEVEQTGEGIRISLRTCGENEILVFQEEFSFQEDHDTESIIDALDEGVFSDYTVENKYEFKMMLSGIDDEDVQTDIVREEMELISFIEGYREENKVKAMCAHTNHLVEYYFEQERFATALEQVDRNISNLVTMDLNDEEVKWHLFIAYVLKTEILLNNDNQEGARVEIDRAFTVIHDDVPLWKLGGRRREYYERGMKLRNLGQ